MANNSDVQLQALKSKMGLAKIAYDGYRLQIKKHLPDFEGLPEKEQLGWCRAASRIEAETLCSSANKK